LASLGARNYICHLIFGGPCSLACVCLGLQHRPQANADGLSPACGMTNPRNTRKRRHAVISVQPFSVLWVVGSINSLCLEETACSCTISGQVGQHHFPGKSLLAQWQWPALRGSQLTSNCPRNPSQNFRVITEFPWTNYGSNLELSVDSRLHRYEQQTHLLWGTQSSFNWTYP